MKALAKFMVALVATANIALASTPEMWITSVGLSDPIEFGKIPWQTLVYPYKGGEGGCDCNGTNKYFRAGSHAHSVGIGKLLTIEGKNGADVADAYSTVVGAQSSSFGYGNLLAGHMTSVTGDCAVAIGRKASVDVSFGGTAIGAFSRARYGYGAMAIGLDSEASGVSPTDGSTSPLAIGVHSRATGHGATAIGLSAIAEGRDAIQIGPGVNRTPRTVHIGKAVFVDVARTATNHINAISGARDFGAFKVAVSDFVSELCNAYVLPEDETTEPYEIVDVDYRNQVLLSALSDVNERINALSVATPLAETKEPAYTWHDVIQYLIMAGVALFFVIRNKKKGKDETPPEPPTEGAQS